MMLLRRSTLKLVASWCGVALCAPSVNLENPLSLGSCTCDLTQAQCDINCCCDPDCAGLTTGFSCLPEGPQSATSQYCYSKSWLHSVNPRVDLWVVSDDLRGLLCVSVDNSAVQGEVFQNQALLSSSQIDAIIQEQSTQSAATGDVAVRGYRAGDILKVNSALSAGQIAQGISGSSSLENANLEVVRALSVPAADPYGSCTGSGQVVRFLNEVPSTACWSLSANLESQCTTSLNPRQLLETWMLRAQYLPQDMRCGARCVLPTTCLVQTTAADGSVTPVAGCDGNASVPASSFSSGDGSCTCTGAIEDMHFDIHFGLVSDVVTITAVNVTYSLQDINSAGCAALRVRRGGSVRFLQDQSGTTQIEARSGNPGYITGLPLLVADCSLVDGSCNYGPRRDATVPGILPGGQCALLNSTAVTQQVQINFGENGIFGCSLDLTRAELKSLCGGPSALANGFVGYLKMLPFGSSSSWTQIAAFGSVPNDAQDAADFVQVEENPRTETLAFDADAAQKASSSKCTGAVVGVELEVIYSSFGKVGNPQMKVVGARISHQLGELAFTLPDTAAKQSFQFTYTVKFTHTDSEQSEVKVPPRPQVPLSLPPDLFYPFTLGSAGMPAIHVPLLVALWAVTAGA